MPKPLDKAILMSLSKYERLYANFVRMRDGGWHLCWYPKWTAASTRREAVKQRREFLAHLRAATGGDNSFWKEKDVKTIRVI